MENQNGAGISTPATQTPSKKVDVLKSVMNAPSVQEQFRNALKENSGSFIASVIDLYNNDSALQECDPKAVVMEALKAAVLKLPINKALGFAYVLPFKNKGVSTPTFIPGYKGYIQLAMRTGQYRTINADIVYEGEVQKANKLTGEIKFDGKKESDKVIGYFAYFELLNGFNKTLYVTLEDMAKHAKHYAPSIKFDGRATHEALKLKAGKDATGIGWMGDFDGMALKTVLRNLLSKYGYLSIEMQNAIAGDMESSNSNPNSLPPPAQKINIQDATFEELKEEKEEAAAADNIPPYMRK